MRAIRALTLSLLLGVSVFAVPALAQMAPASAPAKAPLKPIFLSGDFLDPALILPVPPMPDTAEGKAQLDEARAIVKAASPEHIKEATADDADESVHAFAKVLPGFDLAKLPKTVKLFKDVENDQDYVTNMAKVHFARRRPYELDNTIPTCVPSPLGGKPRSYPSGHSTLGYTDAIVLAHLMPAKAEVILARAKAYAENRVVCGVHFSSDTVASQALATGIATGHPAQRAISGRIRRCQGGTDCRRPRELSRRAAGKAPVRS